MTAFGIVAASMSVVGMSIMIYLLICHPGALNRSERPGIGLLAASTFLSIFKQLGMAHIVAPFDPWYQMVWRAGIILFFGGLAYRFWKHKVGNDRQARILMAHFASEADHRLHGDKPTG